MATDNKDLQAFARQIAGLDIEISKSSEGVLTVCSTVEPLFCFEADTKEELAALVADTIESYARHFFHIEGLDVKTKVSHVETSLPVERSTPVARLTPVFDLAA